MKIIVAGSRGFNDYEILSGILDIVFSKLSNDTHYIVSGGARGADALGEQYAIENGIPLIIFKANWVFHGPMAGVIRNKHMAANADALVAFWDGKSRGTLNMIQEAEANLLAVKIIRYDKGETT